MPTLKEHLKTDPPWIVGVLNITPDSFSDGSLYSSTESALAQAKKMINAGADIIEIGGEATGKNSKPISTEEEISRISETVAELSKITFVAIDTYKAKTANHCLGLGAKMINDVSALRADPNLAKVIAEHQCWLTMMHSKEQTRLPHVSALEKEYQNVIAEIADFLKKQICYANSQGIKSDKIILDPGAGMFLSHNPNYTWELISRFREFSNYSFINNLMIAVSRKSFLGGNTGERDFASLTTALRCCFSGAKLIRTHNVALTKIALKENKLGFY